MNLDNRLYKLTNSLGNNDACDIKEFQTNKKYFLKEYPFMTDDDFKQVITKGIYTYEYKNGFDRLNENFFQILVVFIQALMTQ